MAEENENETFLLDGEEISLAMLAGIDMDGIAEKRSEAFPKGTYTWEIDTNTPPHLAVVGEGNKKKAAALFKLKCLEVIAMTDDDYKSPLDDLIGKIHNETMFLTTEDSLGYLKAFLKDIGAPYNPQLKVMLFNSAGTRFQGTIGKRFNKDDKDIVYTNIIREQRKLKPISPPSEGPVPGLDSGKKAA